MSGKLNRAATSRPPTWHLSQAFQQLVSLAVWRPATVMNSRIPRIRDDQVANQQRSTAGGRQVPLKSGEHAATVMDVGTMRDYAWSGYREANRSHALKGTTSFSRQFSRRNAMVRSNCAGNLAIFGNP
jgi:hypothetical protein